MPSNHLILCRPLLLPPSIFPSIRVFSSESVHAGLDDAQAGVKTVRRDINNLTYAVDSILIANDGKQGGIKEPLEEVHERRVWKAGLKLNIKKTKIVAFCPITSWQIDGEIMETVTDFIFLGCKNHCSWWLQPWNRKTLAPWKKSYGQTRQHIKKQRFYFADKGLYGQSYGFSSSHVWMWELDQKKAEHWRIDVFKLCCWRRLLRIPALQGDQTVNPKGTQPWIFIGRNDDEAEAPILRPPGGKCQLIRKRTLMLENIEDRRRRGRQGDIVGWHHRLKGHEFEQSPGDDEGQGSLGCCSPWGCKELDTTEWLSNNHVPPTTQTQTQTHTLLKTKVRRNIVYLEYIL